MNMVCRLQLRRYKWKYSSNCYKNSSSWRYGSSNCSIEWAFTYFNLSM